jgi:hypothetical protein
MRSIVVVVANVVPEQPLQMQLFSHDHMIQPVPPLDAATASANTGESQRGASALQS